jgi:hypothetical protein
MTRTLPDPGMILVNSAVTEATLAMALSSGGIYKGGSN